MIQEHTRKGDDQCRYCSMLHHKSITGTRYGITLLDSLPCALKTTVKYVNL